LQYANQINIPTPVNVTQITLVMLPSPKSLSTAFVYNFIDHNLQKFQTKGNNLLAVFNLSVDFSVTDRAGARYSAAPSE
jgi:hypothetical protein